MPVVSSGGIKSHHDTAMSPGPGVVIGRKGSLGTAFFVKTDFWPHDTTLWVKDFHGNDPLFTYFFLRSLDLAKLDSGTANPALNRNQVHPLRCFWPPRETQIELATLWRQLEGQVHALQRLSESRERALDELRAASLHRAFTVQL